MTAEIGQVRMGTYQSFLFILSGPVAQWPSEHICVAEALCIFIVIKLLVLGDIVVTFVGQNKVHELRVFIN